MPYSVDENRNSQGIQELIELLREKGVTEGKEASIKIIEEAEKRAEWILNQTNEEAKSVLAKAHEEAEFIRKAGSDSLTIAFRDIKLRLKDDLSKQFASQLNELIRCELRNPETLKLLLINAISNIQIHDENMDIILPEKVLGIEELRQTPDSLKGGALVEILSEVTRNLLKSEVCFKTGSSKAGIVFSLRDGEIQVDLTDEALTQLILSHLQPRFRAILEGVVT
tara:strand:- start:104890 stop:105564 length:675 start_codon:yes stop_codon:yes gene_type:complete